nr:uncharacterized protein LOC129397231 [Pan paniscus]
MPIQIRGNGTQGSWTSSPLMPPHLKLRLPLQPTEATRSGLLGSAEPQTTCAPGKGAGSNWQVLAPGEGRQREPVQRPRAFRAGSSMPHGPFAGGKGLLTSWTRIRSLGLTAALVQGLELEMMGWPQARKQPLLTQGSHHREITCINPPFFPLPVGSDVTYRLRTCAEGGWYRNHGEDVRSFSILLQNEQTYFPVSRLAGFCAGQTLRRGEGSACVRVSVPVRVCAQECALVCTRKGDCVCRR